MVKNKALTGSFPGILLRKAPTNPNFHQIQFSTKKQESKYLVWQYFRKETFLCDFFANSRLSGCRGLIFPSQGARSASLPCRGGGPLPSGSEGCFAANTRIFTPQSACSADSSPTGEPLRLRRHKGRENKPPTAR